VLLTLKQSNKIEQKQTMSGIETVYLEWLTNSDHAACRDPQGRRPNSKPYDAVAKINDFGSIVPVFWFQFTWVDEQPTIDISIRGNLAEDTSIPINNSIALTNFMTLRGISNYTFQIQPHPKECFWWKSKLK